MRLAQKGFTIIELMVVIAVIGILAAVALPAYQDYMTRTKVSELVLEGGAYKTQITEIAQANNSLTGVGAGVAVELIGRVKGGSVGVDTGVITIIGTASADSVGAAVTIIMTPTLIDGALTWSCAGAPAKYMPASCR